jgi:hypothetical protein
MAVKESIERYRGLSVGIAVAFILLTIWYLWSSVRGPAGSDAQKAFFSVDDGKTWFVDHATKIAPFQHDGATAYRAYVFTCDNGQTKWVGYLERYRDTGKQSASTSPTLPPPRGQSAAPTGHEVKKPGADQWVDSADMSKASAVMTTKCPHNGQHRPIPLEP